MPSKPYDLPEPGSPAHSKFFNPSYTQAGLLWPVPPSDGVLFEAPGYPGGAASDLKIFAIANDMFACGNFRVRYPLMTLATHGARVKVCLLSDTTPIRMEDMYWANVLFVQRASTPEMAEAILMLSMSTGATVVYEIDDFLHGIHPNSPAFELYNPNTFDGALHLQTIAYWMNKAHGTIFSTRELQAVYKPNTRFGHVITNRLDLDIGERDWNGPRKDWREYAKDCHVTDNSLLFGVSFSNTHIPDMEELGDSVREVLSRTRDTFFGMQTAPEMAYEYALKHELPLDRVVYIPPTTFKDYPPSLSLFDVALCPLNNTTFNHCKSNLRILEFGAWGVPYVASRVGPFQRFHQETNGEGGLLAETPNQWTRQIMKLLKSEYLRRLKSSYIRTYVRENYNITDSAYDLIHTLHSFIIGRNKRFRAESLQMTRDKARHIPLLKIPINHKGLCPCGSQRLYLKCCTPAWG